MNTAYGIVVAALCAATSCSDGHVAENPRAAGSSAPVIGAPGSCAEVPYGSVVPAANTIAAGTSASVGVSIALGHGGYVVDDLRVEVLAPGSVVDQKPGGADPLAAPHPGAVKRLERHEVAASDTRFVVDFDGKDDSGRVLPPGDYPVVFEMRSSGRPGLCDGPPARAYGVLTTISWKG
jgi:hypothetical protein